MEQIKISPFDTLDDADIMESPRSLSLDIDDEDDDDWDDDDDDDD